MGASFATDFNTAFPQPFEPSEMKRNVEIYLKKVEDMIRKLEEWFPPLSGIKHTNGHAAVPSS